jgi:superfamily II DNA helicase RecQ
MALKVRWTNRSNSFKNLFFVCDHSRTFQLLLHGIIDDSLQVMQDFKDEFGSLTIIANHKQRLWVRGSNPIRKEYIYAMFPKILNEYHSGIGIGILQWRHCMTLFSEGLKEFLTESNVLDIQAVHSSETVQDKYGFHFNDPRIIGARNATLFSLASVAFHYFMGLGAAPPRLRKSLSNESQSVELLESIKSLHESLKLSSQAGLSSCHLDSVSSKYLPTAAPFPSAEKPLRVSPILKTNIMKLLKSTLCKAVNDIKAEFRSAEQEKAIVYTSLEVSHMVNINKTGSGKTACLLVPIMFWKEIWSRVGGVRPITVIAVPTTALMNQLSASFAEHILISQWDPSHLNNLHQSDVVICLHSAINSETFRSFLRQLFGRLKMIAFDEAHLALNWGSFIQELKSLGSSVEIDTLFYFGTATLPRAEVELLLSKFYLSADTVTIIKPDTVIPSNLHCRVVISDHQSNYANTCQLITKNTSNITFVRTKALANHLAADLVGLGLADCATYHGDIKDEAKGRILHDFNSGKINNVVATHGFSVGVDRQRLNSVIHFGPPSGFSDFLQKNGRGGRDGSLTECVILTTEEELGRVRAMSKSIIENNLDEDKRREAMKQIEMLDWIEDAARKEKCVMLALSLHFDSKARDCKGLGMEETCDFCKEGGMTEACATTNDNTSKMASLSHTQGVEINGTLENFEIRVCCGNGEHIIQPSRADLVSTVRNEQQTIILDVDHALAGLTHCPCCSEELGLDAHLCANHCLECYSDGHDAIRCVWKYRLEGSCFDCCFPFRCGDFLHEGMLHEGCNRPHKELVRRWCWFLRRERAGILEAFVADKNALSSDNAFARWLTQPYKPNVDVSNCLHLFWVTKDYASSGTLTMPLDAR